MSTLSIKQPSLSKQTQLFSRLANNGLIGVAIVQKGRFTFVNRQLAQLIGYECQELLQLPDIGVLFPNYSNLRTQIQSDQPELLVEDVLIHYAGNKIDVEICLIQTQEEGVDSDVLLILDITQRKESERSAQIAALVYSNTEEAIVVTDENGLVVSVNPAFTDITGYSLSEVVGRSMNILSSGR